VSNQNMNTVTLFALLLAETTLVQSADFKGAAEVLRQAAQVSPKPQPKNRDPHEQFRQKLVAFQAQSTNLAPALAAQQWLGLVEDFEKGVW